jgi:PD-(D/E)XK endonuclease
MRNSRRQGDLGEFSAVEWLGSKGYPVWVPIGHSPDYDLVAEIDGRCWFIPAQVVEGTTGITLGGPKYAEYEVGAGASAD